MNFKEFFEKSPKTYVYHVSPDSSIRKLRATSARKGLQAVKQGTSGIYVAPKFKDAVAWAISYVGGKKYYTQEPNDRLKERESGGGWHGESGPRNYDNLTIYKIEIPQEILKNTWSSRSWEPEYFIPSEYLNNMRIVQSKTYSMNDLIIKNNRSDQKRFEINFLSNLKLIRNASKTNLAARYYLELIELYNQNLLKGKKPAINTFEPDSSSVHRIDNEHLIRQKIEKLKDYIYLSDGWINIKAIDKLTKDQEQEVKKIYKEIRQMIENM